MSQEEKIREFWQFAIDAAWDQHRRYPDLSRGTCLRDRSYLFTLLRGDKDEVFARACEMADGTENKVDLDILFPRIFELAVKAENDLSEVRSREFEAGRCFRYNVLNNNWCYIHIYNSKQPESFLADPDYVIDNLRYVMDRAEKEHGCDTLYTVTWLNSLPAFLRFFPEEWHQNISNVPNGEFGPTLGWQGQFINKAGYLNKKTASSFLESGKLPYARVESHCSFAGLRKYLNDFE